MGLPTTHRTVLINANEDPKLRRPREWPCQEAQAAGKREARGARREGRSAQGDPEVYHAEAGLHRHCSLSFLCDAGLDVV